MWGSVRFRVVPEDGLSTRPTSASCHPGSSDSFVAMNISERGNPDLVWARFWGYPNFYGSQKTIRKAGATKKGATSKMLRSPSLYVSRKNDKKSRCHQKREPPVRCCGHLICMSHEKTIRKAGATKKGEPRVRCCGHLICMSHEKTIRKAGATKKGSHQ